MSPPVFVLWILFPALVKCVTVPKDCQTITQPKGISILCEGLQIKDVPKFNDPNEAGHIFKLSLKNNNITVIKNNSFCNLTNLEILLLSENFIQEIHPGAFLGLGKLQTLDLYCNQLSNSDDSLRKGVFRVLQQLTLLTLTRNNFTSFSFIEDELAYNKNLRALSIEGCTDCSLGEGFKTMAALTNLTLSTPYFPKRCLDRKTYNVCNMSELTNKTFSNVQTIKELLLSDCNITRIHRDTFEEMPHLTYLDLSYNEDLGFDGMTDALYGLQGNTKLKTLNVNRINPLVGRATMLTKSHTKFLPKNLKTLHIDLNKIEVLEADVLLDLPQNLSTITASGNRLIYDKYVCDLIEMTSRLRSLDISRQHIIADPFRDKNESFEFSHRRLSAFQGRCETITCNHSDALCIYVPEFQEKLLWRKSLLDGTIEKTELLQKRKNLKYVDLSFNLLTEWQGPVYGVESIERLYLSENYCQNITHYFFDNFVNLTYLDISANFLGHFIRRGSKESALTLKHLSKLKYLNMALNRIDSLPENFFLNLTSLEILILSWNSISTLSGVTLKHLTKLRELYLSYNNFFTLQEDVTTGLDYILGQARLGNRSSEMNVSLTANPMSCLCKNKKFFEWLVKSEVGVLFSRKDRCQLPTTEMIHLVQQSHILSVIDKECISYSVEIICASAIIACILSLTGCLIVYRKRWRLRHLYYRAKRRHRHIGYTRIFEYDAFVSYATQEGRFIKENLVPALEGKHGLKVWAADKDSRPGVSVAENITHAIYNSRKAVIVFSRNYLREGWCDYELNMARMEAIDSKRKMLIFILYEDISPKLISLDVLRLLDSEEKLEFPKHPQHTDVFWSEIAGMITEE